MPILSPSQQDFAALDGAGGRDRYTVAVARAEPDLLRAAAEEAWRVVGVGSCLPGIQEDQCEPDRPGCVPMLARTWASSRLAATVVSSFMPEGWPTPTKNPPSSIAARAIVARL